MGLSSQEIIDAGGFPSQAMFGCDTEAIANEITRIQGIINDPVQLQFQATRNNTTVAHITNILLKKIQSLQFNMGNCVANQEQAEAPRSLEGDDRKAREAELNANDPIVFAIVYTTIFEGVPQADGSIERIAIGETITSQGEMRQSSADALNEDARKRVVVISDPQEISNLTPINRDPTEKVIGIKDDFAVTHDSFAGEKINFDTDDMSNNLGGGATTGDEITAKVTPNAAPLLLLLALGGI